MRLSSLLIALNLISISLFVVSGTISPSSNELLSSKNFQQSLTSSSLQQKEKSPHRGNGRRELYPSKAGLPTLS
ncbi:heterocyst-inhibiting protein PatX [Crinalium epipsammum]|uniref:heterocyst-inhibiting protein PatX n=1 Tax=Crinalium epipsammum TaxID=241425 RepID=UPI0012FCC0A5|nr:hypothetical protein [Crinalium epipsammum]